MARTTLRTLVLGSLSLGATLGVLIWMFQDGHLFGLPVVSEHSGGDGLLVRARSAVGRVRITAAKRLVTRRL